MRLTLRTLLAYLDDTLEPTEIKQIGQKVAESDAAQELIARIKQVTRKRRLTTPPLTGPGAKFDPNVIAEYLDNELSGEEVAEIEKICLESDVHLAEIAACHQILTLVLGEPALVPPTARERMYGLVKGREAIPFRKATAKNPNAVVKGEAEPDETAVLGLPVHKRHASWLKWAIPIAGLFLLIALGAALFTVLHDNHPPLQVANRDKTNTDKPDNVPDANTDKDKADKEKADKEKADKEKADKEKADKEKADKEKADKEKADKEKADKEKADKENGVVTWPSERPQDPSKDRKEFATYEGSAKMGSPSILVARQPGGDAWTRVKANGRVSTGDALVSLPGYSSELRADSGVRLLLWGTLPEFNIGGPTFVSLFESAVTLHDNPKVDLEFTLDRGRVYVTNRKPDKPAVVRVRFGKEMWDFILQPETEIALELVSNYTERINWLDGEEPERTLGMLVMKGSAGLKYDNYHERSDLVAPPGKAFLFWSNKGRGTLEPVPITKDDQLNHVLGQEPFTPQSTKSLTEYRPALDEVSNILVGDKKSIELMLYEIVKAGRNPTPQQKALAIYALGAINAVPQLFDILNKEDQGAAAALERELAVVAMRRWICRGPETVKYLFDPKAETGLLHDRNYTTVQATTLLQMLYFHISDATARQKGTYETLVGYLRHPKMPIRELAYYHLKQLTYGMKGLPEYDPAWSQDRRTQAAVDWEALIMKGQLPPPPPK